MSNQEIAITAKQADLVLAQADLIFDQATVEMTYDRMAQAITDQLGDEDLLLLCVMTGGLVPAAALFTRLNFPVQLDYVHATRYRGGTSGHEISWLNKPNVDLSGRTILVVDDILDEGITLAAIVDFCQQRGAKAVYSAVLVEKKHQRKVPGLKVDFIGLEVEDRYVFGCGMDYHGYLRNLTSIYALKRQ